MERHTPTSIPILQPIRLDFDDDDDDDDDEEEDSHQKTLAEINASVAVHQEYLPRTLGEHNIQRLSILPIYPPFSPDTPMITTPRKPHLLLPNVPSRTNLEAIHLYYVLSNTFSVEMLTEEQYNRLKYGVYPAWFKLESNTDKKINLEKTSFHSSDSFMIGCYQKLYLQMKKRLKVDIPIIDYNLKRLEHCIRTISRQQQSSQTMLSIDELPLALEFFLQFDVDMFFFKTCSFNGVKPRLFENRFHEGLFCIETPESRFMISPCNKRHCLLCHSTDQRRSMTEQKHASIVPFSIAHIHRFVNQYEAILNCPATCETRNCIYVLTCPCGQYDFIGVTEQSFEEILAQHREEGNRIIREFLIGDANIELITHGVKSEKKKINNRKWLYQHSARCSVALQLFLDSNTEYWCLIPMKIVELNMVHVTIQRQNIDVSLVPEMSRIRTDKDVHRLITGLPKPALGFDFSLSQREEQKVFFKHLYDRIIPRYDVDLYNANIVAILPDRCSVLFQQLIESLFITHAECKLNELGHLAEEPSDPIQALHGSWCANLTRRPSSSANQ